MVAFTLGNGDKSNFLKMALELEKNYKIRYLCTDGNPAYGYYRLAEKHVVTKSETCLVEAFNSSLRDMLARLNRRTKRASKSTEMLRLAVQMLIHKQITYNVYL
jgi:IS1 family transposase